MRIVHVSLLLLAHYDNMEEIEALSSVGMSSEESRESPGQDIIERESDVNMQNQGDSVINESGDSIDDYERSFGVMQEYRDGTLPKRFGYFVHEEILQRDIPLTEKDFEQLKKGQCFNSSYAKLRGSEYSIGIDEVIGESDGIVWLTAPSPGTGRGSVIPYYKIDNDTYVMLRFEDNDTWYPLERIEVWDADGNKLRDIEID